MWSVFTDMIIGIFDFITDVSLFRDLRSKHGSRKRVVAEDVFKIAYFDFVTVVFITLACTGLMLLLAFGLGLSTGWSLGIAFQDGNNLCMQPRRNSKNNIECTTLMTGALWL